MGAARPAGAAGRSPGSGRRDLGRRALGRLGAHPLLKRVVRLGRRSAARSSTAAPAAPAATAPAAAAAPAPASISAAAPAACGTTCASARGTTRASARGTVGDASFGAVAGGRVDGDPCCSPGRTRRMGETGRRAARVETHA